MWILSGWTTSEGDTRWRSDEKRGAFGCVEVGVRGTDVEVVVLAVEWKWKDMARYVASEVIVARLGAGLRRQVVVPLDVLKDSIILQSKAP